MKEHESLKSQLEDQPHCQQDHVAAKPVPAPLTFLKAVSGTESALPTILPEPAKPLAVSIPEFCRLTSLGPTTAWKHVRLGKLAVIRVGRRTLVSMASIEAFLSDAGDGIAR